MFETWPTPGPAPSADPTITFVGLLAGPSRAKAKVPERGVEHRRAPWQPVAASSAKAALARVSAPLLPLFRDVVSDAVLTRPLANGLRGGDHDPILSKTS